MSSILDFLQRKQFSEAQKQAAWAKAQIVVGHAPSITRKDTCDAWIKWAEYGNTASQYGWEVDHIYPVSRGGTDHPDNLQALQWQNNRAKGDSVSGFTCAVRAV
jgi:5-methylcytosine-specific restriction endonuclease McrA